MYAVHSKLLLLKVSLRDQLFEMASGQSLAKKGKNCLAVVQNVLHDIHKGKAKIAAKKLHELKRDSIYLTEEAKKLATRLERVEAHYISEGESTLRKIGKLGCQEDALKKEQTSEEAKLASHRSVLRDNEERLSFAERELRDAERKLEKAKEEEVERVKTGAIVGAVVGGLFFFGVGALFGAELGAGVGAIVNACVDEVTETKDQVGRRETDRRQAISAVRESESRITTIQSEIRYLESRIEELNKNRLEYHKKAAEIKEGIVFLKSSVEFWQLFKQASEHGTNRTSVLQKIVEMANKKEGFQTKALCSTGGQRVEKTFLDAWEDMETMAMDGSSHILQIEFSCTYCQQSCSTLPHVTKGGYLSCDECIKHAVEN